MVEKKILIAEDNDAMRLGMAETLSREGFEVKDFKNGRDAWIYYQTQPFNLVVTDLKMPGIDGMEFLTRIKKSNPEAEVLIVSAFGTVETAVKAIKMGASDFLTKPFSPEELRMRVNKMVLNLSREQKISSLLETSRITQEDHMTTYGDMVGQSEPMKNLFTLLEKVAVEDSSVLIEGESGTGKELAARAIYLKSPRVNKPFIKVNCGALNENLLESELFGHEKGSFTGAIRQKKGRFELADGGTIFLDEIGEISPLMQVKLLRVLQENEFERVGGEKTIQVDVRIIAATNRDLNKLMFENKFREDLYYRLNIIPMRMPALRERKADIPQLVLFFLNRIARRKGEEPKQISENGLEVLVNYSWPGNIRELENLIERLSIISAGNLIDSDLISYHLSHGTNKNHNHFEHLPLEKAVESFEKKLIIHALKQAKGVKNKAAKILGIKTSTLYYKLDKYNLMDHHSIQDK